MLIFIFDIFSPKRTLIRDESDFIEEKKKSIELDFIETI